jgi:hypothetical protein
MTNSETDSNDELPSKSKFQDEDIPEWHKELLDRRHRAIAAGLEKLLDWDEVKDSLGKRRHV